MKYRCKNCKRPVESVVSANGRFFAIDAEPTPIGNLTLDRTRPTPLAKVVTSEQKTRLIIALDGAPCAFYQTHQCSNTTKEEIT